MLDKTLKPNGERFSLPGSNTQTVIELQDYPGAVRINGVFWIIAPDGMSAMKR